MANKRIKISELPVIPYARTAGTNTPTVKNSDTVPITVSSTADQTIKKTMSITTREMKRYVLQQLPSTTELVDETTGRDTTLTIAPGMTVRVDTLSADTIKYNTIESAGGTSTQEMANLSVVSLTSTNAITVGNSRYPSTVYASDGSTPLTGALLVSNIDAKFTGKGTTLRDLLNSPAGVVTDGTENEGRVVSIDSSGKLVFSNSTSTILQAAESFASTGGDEAGKLLKVGDDGSLAATTMAATDVTTAVNATSAEFTAASSTDQKLLVYTSATPSLDDIKLASEAHMKLVTDVNEDDDADAGSNAHIIANDDEKKVVVSSPLVLGYKHLDGVDLTEQSVSMNVEAVVGEIRWNFFNGVPTLYLATSRDGTASGSADHPCHWYGVPLFGTIDNTLSEDLTAKEGTYSNDD